MLRLKYLIVTFLLSIMFISCTSNTTDLEHTNTIVTKDSLYQLSITETLDFGNIDISGANKTYSKTVTVTNKGKFAVLVDLPKGDKDISITTADVFNNPLKPDMSYSFEVNYTPKTFGDNSFQIDMSKYIHLPKNNILLPGGQGELTSSDITKATFINDKNIEFDGIIKINAKYSEKTKPHLITDCDHLLNFGNIGKNNSAVKDIILENIGDSNIIISGIEIIANNQLFSVILPETFGGNILPGAKETIQVQVSTGDLISGASGQLVITSNSIDSPYIIDLKVQGEKPNIDFGGSGGQNGGQTGGIDDNGNELGDGEVSGSIDFDSNTIDFGLVSLNKPRVQKLILTNKYQESLIFNEINYEGFGLSIDNEKSTCYSKSLLTGESCELHIIFTASVAQNYTGQLNIHAQLDNSFDFFMNFITKAEGIEPLLSTIEKLNFGNIIKDSFKTEKVVLKNTGKDILDISSISLDDETHYSINNIEECTKKIKHHNECVLNITFHPKGFGEFNTNLNISTNDKHKLHNISLSGIGAGSLLLLINEYNFGSHNKSVTYDLEINNIGYDPIAINNAEFFINTNFNILSNNCNILAGGKKCTIQVEFTPPLNSGKVSDILFVNYGKDNKRYSVSFSGSGAQPIASISVKNNGILHFGLINVGTPNEQSLFIRNIGTESLILTNFNIGNIHGHNEFSIKNNTCMNLVAPGESCEIVLTVTAQHGGTINDQFSFNTNEVNNNDYTVNLSAEATFTDLAISTNSLNFGEKYIYPEQTYNKDLVLINKGTETINIISVNTVFDHYKITNNCNILRPEESCSINVQITPNIMGEIRDILRIESDIKIAPISEVQLVTTGLDRQFTVSPTTLSFGNINIGSNSSPKVVTIRNTGNTELNISSIASTAPFAIVSKTCGIALGPNNSCTVNIKVNPTGTSTTEGILLVKTDALIESNKTVALSVNGLISYRVSTSTLNFGNISYNSETGTKNITLTNDSGLPIKINASINSSDYLIKSNNCATLKGSSTCTITVAAKSITVGKNNNADLSITTSTPNVVVPNKTVALTSSINSYSNSSPGTYNVKIQPGNYRVTLASGGSGGGGGAAVDTVMYLGGNGGKGGVSEIKDILTVQSSEPGTGGTGGLKNGKEASSICPEGEIYGTGGSGGGSGYGGTGRGGYGGAGVGGCRVSKNIIIHSLKTINITLGSFGGGGAGGVFAGDGIYNSGPGQDGGTGFGGDVPQSGNWGSKGGNSAGSAGEWANGENGGGGGAGTNGYVLIEAL